MANYLATRRLAIWRGGSSRFGRIRAAAGDLALPELQARADPWGGDTMISIFVAAEHWDEVYRNESDEYVMELEQLQCRCKELLARLRAVEPLGWPKRLRKRRLLRLHKDILARLRMERLQRLEWLQRSGKEIHGCLRMVWLQLLERQYGRIANWFLGYAEDKLAYARYRHRSKERQSQLRDFKDHLDALYKSAVSNFVQFAVTTSSKFGIDVEADHGIIRLPKYLSTSVHHPLVQMVLFSHEFGHKFVCLKCMAPKSIIGLTSFRMFGHLSELCCLQRFVSLTSLPPKNIFNMAEFSSREESTARSNELLELISSADETSSIPLPGDSGAYHSATADVDGNNLSHNISVLSGERNGPSSSEGARSMLTGGNHHRGTDPAWDDNPVVILDSEAQETITGNLSLFSSGTISQHDGVLRSASGEETQTYVSGSVSFGRFKLIHVHYNPNLGNRIIVSGSELDKLDYYFEFGQGKCIVMDLRTELIIGEGRLVDEDYVMDYLEIPHNRTPGSEGQFSLA